MSASRLAALPTDHLVAEMAAFPLASEAALKLRIVELDPTLSGRTNDLWREAERQVLGCLPAFSVDEAVAIRDRIWFGDHPRGEVPLHCYLCRLFQLFLDPHGPVARPRYPDDAGQRRSVVPRLSAPDPEPRAARARWAWRWLSLALPPDLLLLPPDVVRFVLAENGVEPVENAVGPADIDLLSPTLRLLLKDHGYSESHLHLGAAMDFPLLWLGALYAVASREPDTKAMFASPGAALREGNDLAPWLLRAAIARHVLASYLKRAQGDPDILAGFVTEVLAPRVACDARVTLAVSLHACLDDLLGRLGGSVPGFAVLQDLYGVLTDGRLAFRNIPAALDAAQAADPIAGFFPPTPSATPEMRLVAAAFCYLKKTPEDQDFAVLFWQVIRVRVLFYRHVVQRPMTAGLQWFIRFYDRTKPARKPIDKLLMESAAKLGGAGQGLRSLELRRGPEGNGSALRAFVDKSHSAAEQVVVQIKERFGSDLELGFVFHFTKDRGGGAREGAPQAHRRSSYGDPRPRIETGNPIVYRYARFYNEKRREALALAWMLWYYPRSLTLIRGIDVATDELGVPTWVLAPLFRYLRALSEAAAAVAADGPGTLEPLRCTAHAGEDFVHLLTGLRNVEEAVRRLGLRAGDRIGHGLSLGVDARDWCRRTGPVPIALEERLLDLVWEWGWYGREGQDPPTGRASFLDREIARLSAKFFGDPLPPYEVSAWSSVSTTRGCCASWASRAATHCRRPRGVSCWCAITSRAPSSSNAARRPSGSTRAPRAMPWLPCRPECGGASGRSGSRSRSTRPRTCSSAISATSLPATTGRDWGCPAGLVVYRVR